MEQLNWRYATKTFDSERKIDPADWHALEEALRLSPSSLGLQLWKFIVVEDPALREKLRPAAYGQSQITDAAKLVVFTVKKHITDADIDAHLQRIAEVRGISLDELAPLRGMARSSVLQAMDEPAREAWARRQIYIALGILLTSAAMLGIDACPMEGFSPPEFDAILGLEERGFTTAVIATVGYRSADDKYADMKKVRYPADEVIEHV